MKATTHDGATVAFEVHGDGPNKILLLFQHQPWLDWGYIHAFPEFTFLIVDPRGHGESSFFEDRGKYGLWKTTLDIEAAANAAGFDEFIAWGFSQGAVRVGAITVKSKRVKALICGGYTMLDMVPDQQHFDYMEAEAAKGLGYYSDGSPFDWSESLALFEDMRQWKSDNDLKAVACPKLLYFGSDDVFADAIRQRIPRLRDCGFQVMELPGLDHQTCASRIDQVAPKIRRFLAEAGVLSYEQH
jgi:pimeloyl-ACP methyl ester carboxylesterase